MSNDIFNFNEYNNRSNNLDAIHTIYTTKANSKIKKNQNLIINNNTNNNTKRSKNKIINNNCVTKEKSKSKSKNKNTSKNLNINISSKTKNKKPTGKNN